jgi:hypothetical protein
MDENIIANHKWWMSGYYYYSERSGELVQNFTWLFNDPTRNPTEFYLFQNNMVGELGYAFPAYLPTLLEKYGDVEIIYCDNYYTFSHHWNLDFPRFRKDAQHAFNSRGNMEHYERNIYTLFADNTRLDNDFRFSPTEYGKDFFGYRYFMRDVMCFNIQRRLNPGFYQVRLRGTIDFGPQIPRRDVKIRAGDCGSFTFTGADHLFWYYSLPFEVKRPHDSIEIEVECPVVKPSDYSDTLDERALGLRFYWLFLTRVDLNDYRQHEVHTLHYDIGTSDSDGICIGDGIYPFIEEDVGEKFRWTNGNGQFFIPVTQEDLDKSTALVLNLRQNCPLHDCKTEFAIFLNGEQVATREIGRNFEDVLIPGIKELLRPGINQMEIKTSYWIPSEVLDTTDSRHLGVQVNYIALK